MTNWDDVTRAIELATLDLVGKKGYVHGFRYVGGPGLPDKPPGRSSARSRGFGPGDIRSMRSTAGREGELAHREQPAKAGTPGHVAELRTLADEADRHQVENYMMGQLHGGGSSPEDLRRGAGGLNEGVPASPAGMTLRRAADMIERGQPSLAREHSRALADAAKAEHGAGNLRPGYARRLAKAAAKLHKLPAGQGLAANPKDTPDSIARTAAARAYALRTAGQL